MAEQNISPEQLKELQDKIKNMSPEELKEFQKKQCIFCQIISGKIQAKKIFEDDKVLGILDINPANPGHTLLMTREHYSIMPQIPEDEVAHVFMVAKHLSNSMLRSIDAQGTNIIVANGVAAGQRAQHFMAHVIPRKENDGVNFVLPQKTMDQNDIEELGNKLAAALGGGVQEGAQPMPLKIPEKNLPPPPEVKIPERKLPVPEVEIIPPPPHPKHEKEEEKTEEPEKKVKKSSKSSMDLDDISRVLGVK